MSNRCGSPVRCTPPSTRRSGCCRWWPAATAATSAGCRRRSVRWTGLPTIFVYDGYPGGAGFADRGFEQIAHVVGCDGRGDRGLRMPAGLPVVCAVAEVRERKRPAGQGGCGAGAASGAARIAASGKMKSTATADPSTAAPVDQQSTVPVRARRAPNGFDQTVIQRDPFQYPPVWRRRKLPCRSVSSNSEWLFSAALNYVVYTKRLRISLSTSTWQFVNRRPVRFAQ